MFLLASFVNYFILLDREHRILSVLALVKELSVCGSLLIMCQVQSVGINAQVAAFSWPVKFKISKINAPLAEPLSERTCRPAKCCDSNQSEAALFVAEL